MENPKLKYADIKVSIKINHEKKLMNDLLVTNCLTTSCETCITNACVTCTACAECVTNACIQCVTNGSGNGCTGFDSLTYSPCHPKVDLGNEMYTEEFSKMEVHWND